MNSLKLASGSLFELRCLDLRSLAHIYNKCQNSLMQTLGILAKRQNFVNCKYIDFAIVHTECSLIANFYLVRSREWPFIYIQFVFFSLPDVDYKAQPLAHVKG